MGEDNKRRGKARMHRDFWDNQCQALNTDRKNKRGMYAIKYNANMYIMRYYELQSN